MNKAFERMERNGARQRFVLDVAGSNLRMIQPLFSSSNYFLVIPCDDC